MCRLDSSKISWLPSFLFQIFLGLISLQISRQNKRSFSPSLSSLHVLNNDIQFRMDELPMFVDGDKLRSLSKTSRSACLAAVTYDDQQRCHRIPNEILVTAYNSTDDMRIKQEIVAFNYSKHNILASVNNKKHSDMEQVEKGRGMGS